MPYSTYRAMHNVSPEVNSQISASTIRLLLAHVVHFVSEVVRRAIISREQEMIAKTQTKVWRLAENQVSFESCGIYIQPYRYHSD